MVCFDSIIIYSLDFTPLDIQNVVINETVDPSINVIYNEMFNNNLSFRFGGNVQLDAYGDHVDIILKFSNTNNNEIYQIGHVNINSINLKPYDIDFPPSSPEVLEGFNTLMNYNNDFDTSKFNKSTNQNSKTHNHSSSLTNSAATLSLHNKLNNTNVSTHDFSLTNYLAFIEKNSLLSAENDSNQSTNPLKSTLNQK